METFWIEAGAMSGGSRNQIEFDADLAAWLTPELPPLGGSTTLRVDVGRDWIDCILAHKQTSLGVDIYRLNLPTEAKGGFDYPGTVVVFERQGGEGSPYFRVSCLSLDSTEYADIRSTSSESGVTGGGRAYGFSD